MTEELTTTEITGVRDSPAPSPLDFTEGVGTTSPGYPLPFLFAWVDGDQTTFDETMLRVDEDILDIDLEHDEGQIPTLSITIKNPRAGLLNAKRYQWAWLAYQPPNLDPYAEGTFSGPGDFSSIPNGYGSSGATNNTPPTLVGTPEWVSANWVAPGWQVYDGATNPITPPVPTQPNLGTSPSPPGGASGPPPYMNGNTVIPIFFGVLIGVPDDLFAEKITLKFLARSMNYFAWKQACAETLRISPNYDPVFLSDTERDNPDKILEGWSSLYHVDRTSLEVTASDVLVGEDGTVDFPMSPPSAFYDSLKVKIGQAPLTNVQVQATVHWTQRTLGYVQGPDVNVASYTGGTFADDWMGMGELGAGWRVEEKYVNDPYMVKHTPNWHVTTSWLLGEPASTGFDPLGINSVISELADAVGAQDDSDCIIASKNESQSGPALLGPALSGGITTSFFPGVCAPKQKPHPVNLPYKLSQKFLYIPLWNLNCSWTLQYKAKREFTEMLFVDVTANTQSVLTSPLVEQDTALIKMNGEVGEPIIVYEAWTEFANSLVSEGQMIYPNDPTTPGGLSYQVAINSGYAGKVEPVFSDALGAITQDNQVQWASLGETPQNHIQNMAFGTNYGVGQILNYTEQVFDPYEGALVDTLTSQYYLVTKPCSTTTTYTPITYTPPITESDQALFPPAQRTILIEQFSPVDGMVPLSLNPSFLGIPVGGTADNVTARCFFPTSRGQQSVEYAVNRARAKIRMRSRAIEISWECPIEMVLGMSCRMNATIYDPRIPSGVATGKVISYGMTAKGGKIRGKVTIGCSVGYNAFGSPNADISYTAPVFEPFDDGLQFPLSYLPCDGGSYTNTLANQEAAILLGMAAELKAMAIENPDQSIVQQYDQQTGVGGTYSTGVGPSSMWQAKEDSAVLPAAMQGNAIGWWAEIDPVTNGPFDGAYTVTVTPLELPQGIDLTAASEDD